MVRWGWCYVLAGVVCLAQDPPASWVDPATGHRVIRLTQAPDSASLYFNQQAFSADGRKMVLSTREGIAVMDLASRETRVVVPGRDARLIEMGRRSRNLYFLRAGAAWSADIDTGAQREIGKLPPRGGLSTVNADETLLAGTYIEGQGTDYNQRNAQQEPRQQVQSLDQPLNKGQMMEQRLAARLPMAMYTMNIGTGEVKVILRATDWLNHLLFSPADPSLLMLCHEGPWHKVERIWTIRTDGSQYKKIHTRTMEMEIFGHEFWSPDGKSIYYDLQTPRGEVFWLVRYQVDTGERTYYSLGRNEWSIHFNVTANEKLICGDGGDPGQVAKAPDGRWIYLFRPAPVVNRGVEDKSLIRPGVLRAEKLVDMSRHQYRLEPNVRFSPDEKWVIFRSNMFGPTHTFAVEVEKAAPAAAGPVLFRDDFSSFPAGLLSQPVGQLNAAIQEYHYLPHRGVKTDPWFNPINHDDTWLVSDENGKSYLEQHAINARAAQYNPLFITGDPEWSDATVEAQVRPLSLDQFSGVVFRYRHNRHYYLFALKEGRRAVLTVRLPLERQLRVAEWRELASAEFAYDTKRWYALKVENDGPRIRAYIDGKLALEASDAELLKGKAGVAANAPARFTDFAVTASAATAAAIGARIAAREAELEKLRAENPRPKLWKKFETPGYGAGRNVRFGDLDGDGQTDMLIAQNIPRVRGDAFSHISCLTAVTLDGKVLWQSGRPDPRNGLLTNDTPFQIKDGEVWLVRDFQLQVLDGKTGKQKRSAWMPQAAPDLKERPYELHNGDSLAFLNGDVVLKDRYLNFWVYSPDLKLKWQGTGQTGHFPYPFDADGDGKEEMLLGYAMWSHDGRLLWSRDKELKDHADGISMGNYSGDAKAPPMVYACGSDEGFLLFDRAGKLLKHVRVGHAQSPSIAKYRMDVPGLQLLTINYWRNPGILSMFDSAGNLLQQEEPIHSGSPLLPVNWRGDGQEFSMLSPNEKEGGLIDGRMRRAVMFPGDGHPDLAYNVMDLTGDPRDEIIVWDTKSVWIYTQDRPFTGQRIYAPQRNPDFNESNYRTNVSLPAWKTVR